MDAPLSPAVAEPETPGVVIGNHTAKYTASHPAIRWLTERWVTRLTRMIDRAAREGLSEVAEVGCGEGVIAELLHARCGRTVALDLPDAGLRSEWKTRPGPGYLHGDALRLPLPDDAVDLVVCAEVLEHVTDPRRALQELARVSRRSLVVSVPREPLFRGSNLVAGRYVRDLGNTPGHLNHWSRRSLVRFLSSVGEVRAVDTPYPWTIAWVVVDGG